MATDTSEKQRLEAAVMVARRKGAKVRLELTARGILCVAALVASTLLSTAVLVHVAVRHTRR